MGEKHLLKKDYVIDRFNLRTWVSKISEYLVFILRACFSKNIP